MAKRANDILYQLIHSMEKSEKRHFKLYIRRSSSNEDLKIVQLFDAIDKLSEYDEALLLKRTPGIKKAQLSNLKAHLYREILASLRLLKSTDSVDLQLNEQWDYAHILYKKGLFNQSLRILEKAREMAKAHQKITFLIQVLSLEKRIESLHITRSIQDRAENLSQESMQVSTQIDRVTRLSNLALQLYSWYIKHGHARTEEDLARIKAIMKELLPPDAWKLEGFYEQLFLCQSYCWYAYIKQDFIRYYRNASKWVALFEAQPLMKRVETGHYIKGLHNLLNAHFDLGKHKHLEATLKILEDFSQTERVQENENFRVHCFLYITQARINEHYLRGAFSEGLQMVPAIEEKLEAYHLFIDPHRVMVFHYKIAGLYFGAGDYDNCIEYLNRIINENVGLRYDVQCYARLLHLLTHFELGNFELIGYLSKSVHRFMEKLENLSQLEMEILRFLKKSSAISSYNMKDELKKFLERIEGFEKNPLQTRVFVYLDIISWVKSKVYGRPMRDIIREKFQAK